MPTVSDYLDIDLGAARTQWRAIRSRQPVATGRQVDFTPVETLLCLAASYLVNHRRYGGSTAHRAQEPVPTLARLFSRPNSSVLAKMANLDGSRRNGARHEVEVAATLMGDPDRLGGVYRLLLRAAREEGVGEGELSDFLRLEGTDSDLVLLGQEELDSPAIEAAIEPDSARWRDRRADIDASVTERLLMAAVRVGQHRFAVDVLRNHGHRCAFCGLTVTVSGRRAPRMLVASHIKPWAKSTPHERLDIRNGLAACPTHDAAFDTGLLTVNGGLRIHVRPELALRAEADPVTRAAFGRPPLADRLLLPPGAVTPGAEFLTYHHEHIFRLDVGWPRMST